MVIDFEIFAPGERLFLFFLVGHVGYLLHYVKKYSRSETTLAPVDYYFQEPLQGHARLLLDVHRCAAGPVVRAE